MTPHPIIVGPQTQVAEIAQLLLEHQINSVPVIDTHAQTAQSSWSKSGR
ncbi:CBS domain-containing protein [Acidithiobacillus albertensis]|nr:CBS domain-containing protein [Acidithiobacillus albertensis]